MKATASKASPKRTAPPKHSQPSLAIPYTLTQPQERIATAVLALLAVIAGLLYILPMSSTIGADGFPLDDAWIPLTFARNLREFGAYSFFERGMVTSGATSPLYVFVLALFGFIFSNEFTLSWIIGIASFAAVVVLVFRIGRKVFAGEEWLALAAAASVLLIPRLQSAAVSGMPTLLYAALALWAVEAFLSRRLTRAFAAAGAALWVRPDALVLVLAMALHMLYDAWMSRRSAAADDRQDRAWTKGAIVFAAPAALYVIFNEVLSGSIFPTSVAARIAYYKDLAGTPFGAALFAYFTGPVAGAWFVFAVAGFVIIAVTAIRREAVSMLVIALYIAGGILAYAFILPQMYEDGRYMAPLFPFFILLGVWGIRRIFDLLLRAIPIDVLRTVGNAATIIVVAAGVISGLVKWDVKRTEHYTAVQYVADRQVAAAQWIAANTPKSAIVATHTTGALGYYGNRMIVDITGQMTPALIPSIGNLLDVARYLNGIKAEYITALRERFEIVNVNPLFTSDPHVHEVMEVLPYTKGRTHIMSQRASYYNAQAAAMIQAGQNEQAVQVLNESFKQDPLSSRTATLLAVGLLNMKDTVDAEKFLNEALRLHPDYASAMTPLADIKTSRKQYNDAMSLLGRASQLNPNSQPTLDALQRCAMKKMEDSLAAIGQHMTKLSTTLQQ